MSSRHSILVLLLAIAVVVAAHLTLDFMGAEVRAVSAGEALAPGADGATMLEFARPGLSPVVLVGSSGWRFVEPFLQDADSERILQILDALAFVPLADRATEAELLKLGHDRRDFALDRPQLKLTVRAPKGDRTIAFGRFTADAAGIYAQAEDSSSIVIVPSNVFAVIDVSADDLRVRALVTVKPEAVVAFDFGALAENRTRFCRTDDVWRTSESGKADASTAVVASFLETASALRAADFVWPVGSSNEMRVASASLLTGFGLDPESRKTLTLRTIDGAEHHISFGRPANAERIYALADGGNAIVTVPREAVEKLVNLHANLADVRLFPFERAEIDRFLIAEDAAKYSLRRDEKGGWTLESPVVASADAVVVERFVRRVLALKGEDVDPSGPLVSLTTNREPVAVSRRALLGDDAFADLRSKEILRIDPKQVKRLSLPAKDADARAVSAVYDFERMSWNVEVADEGVKVDEAVVKDVLSALDPLVATQVVKLRARAEELSAYGLDDPVFTLAIDRVKVDSVRRNILLGKKTKSGRYATVGSSEAIFVISAETAEKLMRPFVK